jgi:hypothetical protein
MPNIRTAEGICVWMDNSDPHNPVWIVSRDTLDHQGRADTTATLGTYNSETDAIAAGRVQAEIAGLPMYRKTLVV